MNSFYIFANMFKWGIIFIFLLTSLFAKSQNNRDFTLWNKNEVSVNLCDKMNLAITEKIHYSPNKNSLDLKYGEILAGYKPKKWLEYRIGFRHSYLNLYNGEWLTENRPMLFLSLSKKLEEFKLIFLNRLEWRTFTEADNYFRHKQSLKLQFPKITEWGMQFYISEESFLKLNEIETHQARLFTGIKALDRKHFDVKVYYSLQKKKADDNWYTSDILGLNLSVSI